MYNAKVSGTPEASSPLAWPDDRAIYEAIANNFWLSRPNCLTCANRGEIDGLSQETHCSHCVYQEKWRTSHYVPNASGKPTTEAAKPL